MLRKLMKYEISFIARKWWIIAASLLGASVVGAFLLRAAIASSSAGAKAAGFVLVVCVLYLIAYAFALVIGFAGTSLLLYWRFYAHFYSDQGYLTFTLPIKRRTLHLSKILNGMLWQGVQLVLLALCALIFFLIAPPATPVYPVINPVVFQMMGRLFSTLGERFGGMLAIYALEIILLVLAYLLFSLCLVYFCITVGAVIAKKYKLLVGIGIFYAVNMVISGVGQLLIGIIGGYLSYELGEMLEHASSGIANAAIALVLLIVLAALLLLSGIAYCLTQDKLDHKLNLA